MGMEMSEPEAMSILKLYGTEITRGGLIVLPSDGFSGMPKILCEAIIYLCNEWDYDTVLSS